MRNRGSSAVWLLAAALAAIALLVALRGRDSSSIGSLSSPTLLPVPGVQGVDTLQDLLRSPDDPRAVGDPRFRATPPAEPPPEETDR